MANFPGGSNSVPGVVVETVTLSRGVSVPSGTRLAVIIGEGAREERLIASAVGGGRDGLDSTYTTTTGADGRHFQLSNAPVISNRTRLFKNGIPLTVLEDEIDDGSFDSRFDARIDIETGRIELQAASLVDQGGEHFAAASTNVGDGEIDSLELLDENAPTETWTVRVASTRKDGYGDPIDGYAKFVVRGSVSGIILDGYGQQITWQSNGVVVSNGILRFSITEGATPFREGDSFTIRVRSGTLVRGDSLSAIYIAEADINDPQLFTDINALVAKHGTASLTNRLSLGARINFANGSPGVYALQAAPAVPRRQSFVLVESASGEADPEDLSFPLPLNILPDSDSNINFFVTNATTGVETQILPNKVEFYDPTITSDPESFQTGVGYDFSYTVVLDDSVQKAGDDGAVTVVTGTTGRLASDSVTFGIDDLSATRSVKIFNATNAQNNGTFTIASVSNGEVVLNNPSGFVAETGLQFEVIDSATSSARVLFTDDLALGLGESLRCTLVDAKDADFFDAGWVNAYEAAERIDIDMVVPLPSQTISAIFQNGKVHVETMSQLKNRRERILLIGAIRGLDPEHVIGTEPAAVEDIGILEGIQGDEVSEILAGNEEDLVDYGVQNAFGTSFRTVFFYPDEIVVQVGSDNVLTDGFFMAAAAAGFFSGTNNPNVPLTNKVLSGFTIRRDKLYAPLTIENLAAAGITVLQPVIGGGRVVWGKTTTTSGFVEEEEISIVFIRDRIAKDLRSAFRGFIGMAETPTFQATLFARASAVAKSFLSQQLITDYKDITVVRDDVDPRQWNITIAVQPTYPINWIYIRVNLGLL